jgi:hypothetical protein
MIHVEQPLGEPTRHTHFFDASPNQRPVSHIATSWRATIQPSTADAIGPCNPQEYHSGAMSHRHAGWLMTWRSSPHPSIVLQNNTSKNAWAPAAHEGLPERIKTRPHIHVSSVFSWKKQAHTNQQAVDTLTTVTPYTADSLFRSGFFSTPLHFSVTRSIKPSAPR